MFIHCIITITIIIMIHLISIFFSYLPRSSIKICHNWHVWPYAKKSSLRHIWWASEKISLVMAQCANWNQLVCLAVTKSEHLRSYALDVPQISTEKKTSTQFDHGTETSHTWACRTSHQKKTESQVASIPDCWQCKKNTGYLLIWKGFGPKRSSR